MTLYYSDQLIEISGNYISNEALKIVGYTSKPQLTTVTFNDCTSVDDTAIDILCRACPNLKTLRLNRCNNCRTDAALRSIVTYCPHIEVLSLHRWLQITDISLSILAQLSSLKQLELTHCESLTSAGIQSIIKANLNLTSLVFYMEALHYPMKWNDNDLIICISHYCPRLTTLHLSVPKESSVTNASLIAMIRGCPLLEDVQLSSHDKPRGIISALASCCPRLQRLYLIRVQLDNDDINSLQHCCPALLSLRLDSCKYANSTYLTTIATYCHKLRELSIGATGKDIADELLCNIFLQCIHLESVELADLSLITDLSILTLLQCRPRLKSLTLINLNNSTDQTIVYIAMYGRALEALNIHGLKHATDNSLILISQYNKYIHTISLRYCPVITDHSIKSLINNCKYLTRISVYSCTRLRLTSERASEYLALCTSVRRYKKLTMTML